MSNSGYKIIHRLLASFLLFGTLLYASASQGQSKDDLQKKKKELEKNINYTNSLLTETKKNKEASINQLTTLKNKIVLRQRLIRTINHEVRLIDNLIDENNEIIRSLEKDLEDVKREYARMIYYGYKNRSSYDKIVFVFSSKDFNQAQKRLKYIQDYGDYRKKQASLILQTKGLLKQKIESLEARRNQKKALLMSKEEERGKLAAERLEKNTIYERLKTKESMLKSDLRQQEKESVKLQKAIADIIAEEIRLAREAAKKTSGFTLTPEEAKLSASFKSNKGKLPWPVKRGIITGHFGEHDHAVLQGIKINNNGIDVSTNKGAVARAVFDGIVTGVIILPGANKKAVIVRHGEYFSVYGNLQETYVKKGDHLMTKQDIGMIFTDGKKFKTEAHLEIWKISKTGTIKLDPETWITKRGKSQ